MTSFLMNQYQNILLLNWLKTIHKFKDYKLILKGYAIICLQQELKKDFAKYSVNGRLQNISL